MPTPKRKTTEVKVSDYSLTNHGSVAGIVPEVADSVDALVRGGQAVPAKGGLQSVSGLRYDALCLHHLLTDTGERAHWDRDSILAAESVEDGADEMRAARALPIGVRTFEALKQIFPEPRMRTTFKAYQKSWCSPFCMARAVLGTGHPMNQDRIRKSLSGLTRTLAERGVLLLKLRDPDSRTVTHFKIYRPELTIPFERLLADLDRKTAEQVEGVKGIQASVARAALELSLRDAGRLDEDQTLVDIDDVF